MDPFPRPERQSDESESREKLTWPWEKAPDDKEVKKKLDTKEEKESKKKPEQPKEEKPEKLSQEEEKRERRATLVEQSLALVAKYEEEPIPRDANTLARLMIAHQVINLNNQLEQPNNEHLLAPEEIEATLDYITQLDEKLKNPDTKAEPAIEQSYQEIMELAEATLEEEQDLEKVVASMDVQSTPDDSKSANDEPYAHLSTEGMSPSRANRAPWAGSQPPIKRPEGGDGEQTANKTTEQDRPDIQIQEEFDRRHQAAKETVPAVATASALIYLITHLGRNKQIGRASCRERV